LVVADCVNDWNCTPSPKNWVVTAVRISCAIWSWIQSPGYNSSFDRTLVLA
jgi:hypothetical protein